MTSDAIKQALAARFQDAPDLAEVPRGAETLAAMAGRGSCRAFRDDPVPKDWLTLLSAVALSSPTKSDLQQRDIIMLRSTQVRRQLADLVAGQDWVRDAPMIAVFCGNNRRQRLWHAWKEVPFANDHFDAAFNAAGDAAIALGAFVTAAEAMGLGSCPISAVRNEAQAVSSLLDLPDHVFPFAGLAFGFPAQAPKISKRLPLKVTYHEDRYTENDLKVAVDDYDADRTATQPYAKQRFADRFGLSDSYGWSDDKARQYSTPERADFGALMRAKGFRFD